MTIEDRTWKTEQDLAQQAKDMIAFFGTRPSADEATFSEVLMASTRTLQRALGAAGTSFSNERLKRRMAHAEWLLTTTHEPLAEIARRCLYAHAPAFTRAFKRHHGGMTPREWRALRIEPARTERPKGEVFERNRWRFNAVARRNRRAASQVTT